MITAALMILVAQTAPAPEAGSLDVAVFAVRGSALPGARLRATQLVIGALRGLPRLKVISLVEIEPLLGAEAARAFDQCRDDACLIQVVSAVKSDRLVIGELEAGAGMQSRLQVRLVDTSTSGANVLVRLSRDLTGDLISALEREVPAAVAELFPDRAAEGYGSLVVRVRPEGAAISLDGMPVGIAPTPPLKARVGRHRLRVTARGHEPQEEEVYVPLGQALDLRIDLDKRRSDWPLILAASALGATGIGFAVGISAESVARDWERKCEGGLCPSGYTRARYENDRDSTAAKRTIANGLFIAAGALAVGSFVYYILDPGVDEEEK
jgi:hypothetical protein